MKWVEGIKQMKKPRWIYKAVRSLDWGMTNDGRFVTGLVLVPHSLPDPDEFPNFVDDVLQEELVMAGTDADIILPNDGLVEGGLYEAGFSGFNDDTTLTLRPYAKARDALAKHRPGEEGADGE